MEIYVKSKTFEIFFLKKSKRVPPPFEVFKSSSKISTEKIYLHFSSKDTEMKVKSKNFEKKFFEKIQRVSPLNFFRKKQNFPPKLFYL